MHVAMFEAINAITPKYTPYLKALDAPAGSSVEAAAASAAHGVLVAACPDQKDMFDGALKGALEAVSDVAARDAGAKVGRDAAAAVLAARADSGAELKDPVFEPPAPGRYVPTMRRVGLKMAAAAALGPAQRRRSAPGRAAGARQRGMGAGSRGSQRRSARRSRPRAPPNRPTAPNSGRGATPASCSIS